MDQDNYDDDDVTMEVDQKTTAQTGKSSTNADIQVHITPQPTVMPILQQQQQQALLSHDAMRLRATLAQRGNAGNSLPFTPNIPSSGFSSQSSLPSQAKPAAGSFPSSIPLSVQHAIHDRAKLVELEEDKAFIDLLQELESFEPIIPDQLTDYFMTKAGLDCSDVKSKRLISLIAQKYVTDIAQDAVQYCKIRTNATGTTGLSATNKDTSGSSATTKKSGAAQKEKKLILSMDDLSCSLSDYGIALKKPSTFR